MDTEAFAPDLKNNEAKPVPPRKNGGRRPGAGRKKGSPNKLTTNVRACIMAAFNDAGGREYLVHVARKDPRTFCTLLGKILPTQVAGDADAGSVRIELAWLRPSPAGRNPLWPAAVFAVGGVRSCGTLGRGHLDGWGFSATIPPPL